MHGGGHGGDDGFDGDFAVEAVTGLGGFVSAAFDGRMVGVSGGWGQLRTSTRGRCGRFAAFSDSHRRPFVCIRAHLRRCVCHLRGL